MFKPRAAIALVACMIVWSGIAAGGSAAALGSSKISWSKCYAQFGPFECGTVQVPLDYDEPQGSALSLAVVRLPASDPAHRIGSLFLNPGGPGGSGVDFTVFAGPFLFTPEVRARFDLVGFDPRGTNRSTALRCFGTTKQWAGFLTPFAFPVTPEQEQIWIAADRFFVDACVQRGGKIAEHMATADVARDLDMLRDAVGDDKLSYYGVSYGSFLGVTYANMFPNNFRALVVDGVLDPIAWVNQSPTVPFSSRLRSDAGAQATLDEFFRLCDAGGPRCAFGPSSKARFAAIAEKLKTNPVDVTLPDGSVLHVDYTVLIGQTLGAMYDSLGWEGFAQALADLEQHVSSATLAASFQRGWIRPGYITKRGFPNYPNFFESFVGVACSDSDNPTSYSAWSTTGAALDAFGYFGRIWTWVSSPCAIWPFRDSDRYLGPFNRRTAKPVLVVGNNFDPATRYEGALTVAGLMANSALLTVHAWGHTSLFLSRCADAVIARYLIDVATPAGGTVCEQDHVPFSG